MKDGYHQDPATCEHSTPTSVWVEEFVNDWGDTEPGRWEYGTRSADEDISIGAFRCSLCGRVGYYTGTWRNYYENGVDCAGTFALQPGETERVRRAAGRAA